MVDTIKATTKCLIELGKEVCTNTFYPTIYYVRRDVDVLQCQNAYEEQKSRLNSLIHGKLLTVDELSKEIEESKTTMHWVDFLLYYSSCHITVIIVEFIQTPNNDSNTELNFHCSIYPPIRDVDTKEKFDLNWQYNTYLSKWKIFLWKWNHHIRQNAKGFDDGNLVLIKR